MEPWALRAPRVADYPVIPRPGREDKSAVLRESGGLGAPKVALLALGIATIGATCLALLSPTMEPAVTDPSLLSDRATDSAQAELHVITSPSQPARERVATVAPSEGDSVESAAAPTQAVVRFVDEVGDPVPGARAVWADEASTPHALDVDRAGTLRMHPQSRGRLFAGAAGFETSEHPISWSETDTMTVTLNRSRTIRGQLLIDGVAPGRVVTLWKGDVAWNWGFPAGSDPRLQGVIRSSGLVWGDEPIATDQEGNFSIVTRTAESELYISMPGDLRLVDGVGIFDGYYDNPGGYATEFGIDASTTEIVLYAESSIAAEARFVDGLDEQPVQGFAFVISYDATGKRLGRTLTVGLDHDGRLRLPARQRASIHDANWIPCHRYEIQVAGQLFRVALTQAGEAEDLGTFKVERAPFAHLRLRVRSKNGLEPLRGVVDSGDEALWSEADGDVRIRASLGTVVRVLAAGHALREQVIEPGAQNEETPQIIELQPAARLGLRFELGSKDGSDPKEPVKIELRSRTPIMAGLDLPTGRRKRKSRYDLYDHFYGAQLDGRVMSTSDGESAVQFEGLPARILWIDGLLPGARFDVIVRDSKGEALASEHVVMPAAGATDPLLVELAAH